MRIIDILVKVTNDEEVPVFKYKKHRYKYSKENKYFEDLDNDEYCKPAVFLVELNDEVEIIEDTPKVQVEMTEKEYMEYLDSKLDTPKEDKIQQWGKLAIEDIKKINKVSDLKEYIEVMVRVQNEIIDKINGE